MNKEETLKQICKINRSFPKVVDKSYEQLQQENKKQKEVIDKINNYIEKETKSMPTNGCKIRLIEIQDILNEVSE